MRVFNRFILIIVLAFFIVASGTIVTVKVSRFENALMYSSGSVNHVIPQPVFEWLLYKMRGTKKDIAYLEENYGGVGFVLSDVNGLAGKGIELAKFLLAKGADINLMPSTTGIPALNGAVLVNNVEHVQFLLDNGADPLLKIQRLQTSERTALELARHLGDSKKLPRDYTEMIKLLEKYEATIQ